MTLDHRKLLATPAAEIAYRYTARDTILHGLGVGLGMDALDRSQIAFLYGDAPKVFPTQSAAIGWVDLTRDPRFYDPAWGLDANRIVVGESIVTQLKPLPIEGSGVARMYFAEVVDKGPGKAALIRTRKDLHDEAGALLATLDTWLFVRGAGGFGGHVGTQWDAAAVPAGPPGETAEVPTAANQALLFRLLGDRNPLHADPAVAQEAGFGRPILHGACTFGIACAEVLRRFCGRDPARLARFGARFAGPLFPGETLRFGFWREGDRIAFRASAAERDALVLDNGLAVIAP